MCKVSYYSYVPIYANKNKYRIDLNKKKLPSLYILEYIYQLPIIILENGYITSFLYNSCGR